MIKISEIKSAIKTKIESLNTEERKIFGTILDYPEGNFDSYPAAIISIDGGDGEVLDTHRNERIYNFTIKLYQEQTPAGKTKEQVDEIMTEATDAILEAFDEDKDLRGGVEIIKVVSFTTDFKVASGTFVFATFNIRVVVIVPSYATI